MVAPIRGAPADVPIPEMPDAKPRQATGRAIVSDAATPPNAAEPEGVRRLETVPGPNEIADRLETLKRQEKYVGKLAFEIAVEKAHLFKIMMDTHRYKSKKLGEFAEAHGTSKSDTYELYKFADYADRALASCLADEALRLHYKWQDWRVVWGKIKRDLKKQQATEPPADDEEDAPDAAPDPVAEITRERDNLAAQVKAATQQYRNERAAREEITEELAELRERLRNLWCASEKALWDATPADPNNPANPPTENMARILAGMPADGSPKQPLDDPPSPAPRDRADAILAEIQVEIDSDAAQTAAAQPGQCTKRRKTSKPKPTDKDPDPDDG